MVSRGSWKYWGEHFVTRITDHCTVHLKLIQNSIEGKLS